MWAIAQTTFPPGLSCEGSPLGAQALTQRIGSRFFDWLEAGKQIYTGTGWTIGFAPRWLAREIERRGIGHDRVLFASDEPWGDFNGEVVRMRAAAGDGGRAEA
jgi:hypothetical protein